MSSGPFVLTKYEADDGKVYPVRVQPETRAAVLAGNLNSPPADDIESGLPTARVGGGRRKFGVNCRGVRVIFDPPKDEYKPDVPIFIPVLTKDVYDDIPTRGGTGTYLGSPVRIVGKSPEKLN